MPSRASTFTTRYQPVLMISFMLLQCCHGFNMQAQQINIRKYSIENGLVNNDILNIYQDSHGFIWLCTRGGLSRYDGSRFSNYTTENGLTNDMINDIVEIAPQEFIVAQNLNGPRLLKNGNMQPFASNFGLTLNSFYRANNKQLLATTDYAGLLLWDSGHFKQLDSASIESIQYMTMINDSVLLLLQQQYSIQFATTSLKPLSPPVLVSATTVFTDSRHRTWVGTVHGLKLLDTVLQAGQRIHFIPLPPSFDVPVLKETVISDIIEDNHGNYWIGTSKGLVKISQNGIVNLYTQQDGLPMSSINCLKEDRQNNLWIGTSLGLAKFSLSNEIKAFPLNLGLSHDGTLIISPVTEDRWRLFDGKNINDLDLVTGSLTKRVQVDSPGYSIYNLDNKQLMVLSGAKASIYYSGQENTETINWPQYGFSAITRIERGDFIASHGSDLFAVLNGNYEKKLSLGGNKIVFHLIVDQKKFLWAGTQADGLFKIKISKHPSLRLQIVDTILSRLPDAHIRTLYADKENELWIGTRYKGVIRLLELPDGTYEMQNYGTRQGLSSDFARTIKRDSSGNIWVGTAQGIDKLIPAGNQYRVFNFGKVNGYFLPFNDIFFLKNNYLLATCYPYLMYMQDMQQDSLSALPVYITKVFTGPGDSSAVSWNGAARLPYNKAQVYFEFSSPQFINEEFSEYSYRLLGGNDTNWTISGKSHSVYFANLRPGNYRFEVRTLGFNGRWGSAAVYAFIVNAPFWQKPWFIVLIIAAIGILIYALYRYRVKQIIRLQKVRNRIATDLHDEIGSNLTNISILSNLSERNILQPQKATDFLQRISQEVASSSQALDDIIWSVNTNHDTLEETVARMRRYAAELFDAANINYDLGLDPAFEERKLDMEQRRDIYLLYKEAVNNISKHAVAKKVSIQIAIEHSQLLLNIKDDGKGFDTNKEFDRHGLQGMKERVKRWKGKMIIQSAQDKGTSIEIRLPVSK
jgi:signal transduction histidine kinase/ligand-binding sensor domain-containing protein